jgi:hypothetical protein
MKTTGVELAGRALGISAGTPRWRRMRPMTDACAISNTRRSRPRHLGLDFVGHGQRRKLGAVRREPANYFPAASTRRFFIDQA